MFLTCKIGELGHPIFSCALLHLLVFLRFLHIVTEDMESANLL